METQYISILLVCFAVTLVGNASGLLPYLIARRNYPVINASKEYQTELEQRKKRILVSLLFTAAGAIGMASFIFLI